MEMKAGGGIQILKVENLEKYSERVTVSRWQLSLHMNDESGIFTFVAKIQLLLPLLVWGDFIWVGLFVGAFCSVGFVCCSFCSLTWRKKPQYIKVIHNSGSWNVIYF